MGFDNFLLDVFWLVRAHLLQVSMHMVISYHQNIVDCMHDSILIDVHWGNTGIETKIGLEIQLY